MTQSELNWMNLWIAALRSGGYQQIQGSLCKKDKGFCCLGVATDVYIKFGDKDMCWDTHPGDTSSERLVARNISIDVEGKEYEGTVLPTKVRRLLGLGSFGDSGEFILTPAGIKAMTKVLREKHPNHPVTPVAFHLASLESNLMRLNDEFKVDFNFIADVIEAFVNFQMEQQNAGSEDVTDVQGSLG